MKVVEEDIINRIASAINIPNFKFKAQDGSELEKNYKPKTKSTFYLNEIKNGQPEFGEAFNFKVSGNPKDEIKFSILSEVLSTRLFDDLREKQGLTYAVSSGYTTKGDMGRILISSESGKNSKEDIKKIYEGFRRNVQDLKDFNITEEELKKAKSSIRIDQLNVFNNPKYAVYGLSDFKDTPLKNKMYENNFEIIEKITPDDIRKAALYAFSEKPDFTADATKEILEENENLFNSLAEKNEKHVAWKNMAKFIFHRVYIKVTR